MMMMIINKIKCWPKKRVKLNMAAGKKTRPPNTITMTRSNIVEKKKKKKGVKWKWSFAQQKKNKKKKNKKKRAYNCIT